MRFIAGHACGKSIAKKPPNKVLQALNANCLTSSKVNVMSSRVPSSRNLDDHRITTNLLLQIVGNALSPKDLARGALAPALSRK